MSTKLKCLLLDDELPSLTYLKMLCEQIPELEVIRAFTSTTLFLEQSSVLEFDLCILDIEMPGLNGLQVAERLNGKPVIFTTAFKDYAADAFDLNAVDYVRKPIRSDRLQLAVQKAIARMKKGSAQASFIQLNTDKGKSIIYPEQLYYMRSSETDSRDKIAFFYNEGKLLFKNRSFASLLRLLPPGQFCQINKKEMIALKSVQHFSHDAITLNVVQPDDKPLVVFLTEIFRKDFIRLIGI